RDHAGGQRKPSHDHRRWRDLQPVVSIHGAVRPWLRRDDSGVFDVAREAAECTESRELTMGYDAPCTLRVGGEASRGTAVLEQHELIFRGPARLSIPLNTIASAVAQDGSLTIRFGCTTAVFEIGKAASRWAERITNPPSRLDKIGAKPTMTALI